MPYMQEVHDEDRNVRLKEPLRIEDVVTGEQKELVCVVLQVFVLTQYDELNETNVVEPSIHTNNIPTVATSLCLILYSLRGELEELENL